MEQPPQLSAILRSLAERLSSLEDAVGARSAPAGEIRQALDDILKIYGITAQSGEVINTQRDQILALTQAIGSFHSRLLEFDRRSTIEHEAIRVLMEQLVSAMQEQLV